MNKLSHPGNGHTSESLGRIGKVQPPAGKAKDRAGRNPIEQAHLPVQPDTTIGPGDRVKSYDFPMFLGRDERMAERCYAVGTVIGFEEVEGCKRYKIEVERRVFNGVVVPKHQTPEFMFPPVNGLRTPITGLTYGVVKAPKEGQ